MTVVLGGSRKLRHLPDEVVSRLTLWLDADHAVVVGDAPGIDTVFQAFLKRRRYSLVTVFTSAPEVRNNLGGWPVKRIESGLKSRSSAMHTAKDREMTRIADLGLMMWDGVSVGTLANVIDLATQGKDAYLFVVPEGNLQSVEAGLGLDELSRGYPEQFAEAEARIRQHTRRRAKRVDSEEKAPGLF